MQSLAVIFNSKQAWIKYAIIGKWKPSFEETASRLTEDNNNNLKNDLSSFKKTFEAMNYEYKEGGKYLYNVGVVPQEDNTIWRITGNTLDR